MSSLEPAAIRLTLECLQESARQSGCFLPINFNFSIDEINYISRYSERRKVGGIFECPSMVGTLSDFALELLTLHVVAQYVEAFHLNIKFVATSINRINEQLYINKLYCALKVLYKYTVYVT